MPSIIIVEKLGTIKSVSMKTFVESELYKKAALKTPDGFKCYTNWGVEYNKIQYTVYLYGKTSGRANSENKYEFPPPVDNVLFFGNCILIAKNVEGDVVDLTQTMWEKIYETLYGGFDDIGNDDSDIECDSDDDPAGPRTKNGYVKDGFVVDDEDADEDDDDDADADEDDEEYVKPVKEVKAKKNGNAKVKSAFELKEVEEYTYLDCSSELTEEPYIT
jgi:hypothetical protein